MWIIVKHAYPPKGVIVSTKSDDGNGVKNEADLIYAHGLWWHPDMKMYVYYTPTHWKSKT